MQKMVVKSFQTIFSLVMQFFLVNIPIVSFLKALNVLAAQKE